MAIESPIRISTDAATLTDESEFLGEIIMDEIEPGSFGPQFHFAVKPLTFAIAGKTGMFHEWAKISRHKRSKLGVLVARFGEVFGPKHFLGEGSFHGKRAWFIRQDIVFGVDRETGEEMKAEGVLQPTRPMEPGDEALIVAALPGAPGADSAPAAVKAPDPADLTDEQIELLLAVLDGANADKMALTAARSNLPAELKQAVMSGAALVMLEGMGLVTIGADRKVTAVSGANHVEPESPAATAGTKTRAPKFAAPS